MILKNKHRFTLPKCSKGHLGSFIRLTASDITLCFITEYYYKKVLPEKEFFPLLRVVLSYTVTSRKFVCQIPLFLLKAVLRKLVPL